MKQKTVKKLDDNVIKALTKACEEAKKTVQGFQWLTHYARYDRFPGSLAVICIFDTALSLNEAGEQELDVYMRKLIQSHLLKIGVVLKDSRKHVFFDNEEDCLLEHAGDWERRLKLYQP
jgi:hypothetical protein